MESQCLSVCPAQVCLEQTIFIFLGQRALRKQSKSNQRAVNAFTIKVIQSEPKILRLVYVRGNSSSSSPVLLSLHRYFDMHF